ncbi:MAG: GNAT family N-acetyltransferase [Proteobacteria bacterium]|nr:GNAT family N-acetyltransferase [Pseudomonadota bacterium]
MENNLEKTWQWLTPEELLQDVAWWAIYKNAFPVTEQDNKQQILYALQTNIAKIGAYQQHGVTQAIVVFYPIYITGLPFVFLNYFAVSDRYQGQGLGRWLFNQLVSELDTILVWEVEDPNIAVDSAEQKLRERRWQFYLRAGAQLLNCQFIQPPIDGLNYVPMRLMCLIPKPDINIDRLERKIVAAIFFKKYKIVNHINTATLNDLLTKIF